MPAGADALSGDPLVSFNFGVEIGSIISGYFMECGGLGSENDVTELKVMGANGIEVVRKIPGRLKWGDITLKRGITTSSDMLKWYMDISQGKISGNESKVSVVMYDSLSKNVMRWNFEGAFPSKWTGPSFSAGSNEVAIETLELSYQSMDVE